MVQHFVRVKLLPSAMSSNKFLIEFTKIYLHSIFDTVFENVQHGYYGGNQSVEFRMNRQNKTDLQ